MKLSALCQKIGSGATPKGGSTVYISQGVSLIRSQNVYNNQFEYGGLCHITDEAARKLDSVTVQEGDVLLNITGDSVARCAIVPREVLPARVNQHVAIIRPKKDLLDNRFLMYYLTSPRMQALMLGVAVGKGASRNALTKGMIENFDFPCLSIVEQRKIVNILAPYDSLIDNNRRQIKLLEEAAQRLYKEWFVDLRFPGHEQTPIVNGVPHGWRVVSVADLGEYFNGYPFKPTDWGKQGLPIIKIKEMSSGIGDDTPRNPGDNVPSKLFINSGDILFSWSATLSVMVWSQGKGLLNQHIFKVVPKAGIADMFVVQAIASKLPEFSNLTTGATMKHIQRGKLKEVFVMLPPASVMEAFESLSKPMLQQTMLCSLRLNRATEARDRLLPKLMSGEVEV